ncbi:hypothetical protein [Sphingobium sp. EP60837]|uniref:hypothetical protein n=1 Tax=Sphingobium sp. EP60837 TaxID=1855519 RepID=UPI0007DE1BC3|nr:hypothetical protein [Sphingobium sp. EP60837]ANI79019.1 hypothetical protein EP837_02624 [Sphingobium sp. EP60837]
MTEVGVKKTTGKRKVGDGTPGPGRPKGVPNKTTTMLKDAILQAATKAGGKDGLIGYLVTQATANPQSFLPLLGKVLPMQVTGEDGGPIKVTRIELVGVSPE